MDLFSLNQNLGENKKWKSWASDDPENQKGRKSRVELQLFKILWTILTFFAWGYYEQNKHFIGYDRFLKKQINANVP